MTGSKGCKKHGRGSGNFGLRTDDAPLPGNFRRRHIQLFEFNNDARAATNVVRLDKLIPAVPRRVLDTLQQPIFRTRLPRSFGFHHEIWSEPMPLLEQRRGLWFAAITSCATKPTAEDDDPAKWKDWLADAEGKTKLGNGLINANGWHPEGKAWFDVPAQGFRNCMARVRFEGSGLDRVKSVSAGPSRRMVRATSFMKPVSLARGSRSPFSLTIPKRLLRRGRDLFAARLDKAWSLTDCTSFVVMQQHGIADALTTDGHFTQAGFRALLAEWALFAT